MIKADDIIPFDGNCPCNGCEHCKTCGADLLACNRYYWYVSFGDPSPRVKGYQVTEKDYQPSQEVFRKIFQVKE